MVLQRGGIIYRKRKRYEVRQLYYDQERGLVNDFKIFSQCPLFRDKIITRDNCGSCEYSLNCKVKMSLFPEYDYEEYVW